MILPALLIPGLVFLAAIVLIALGHAFSAAVGSTTQGGNSGGVLGMVTDIMRIAINPVTGIGHLAKSGVEKIARFTISHWALAHVKPITRWFHSLHWLTARTYEELHGLAFDTAHALERLVGHTIPHEITRSAAGARALARQGVRLGHHALARVHAVEHALTGFEHATLARLRVLSHAVDVAIPRQLGRIQSAERAVEKDVAALRDRTVSLENGAIRTFDWLRTHPLSAAEGAFAIAVSIALGRLGYPFLRCNAWKGLGRQITCGMGTLLSDLLSGVIDVLVLQDLCAIIQEMSAVASTFEPVLTGLVGVADGIIGCSGSTKPKALPVAGVAYAPLIASLSLP